MVTTKLIEILKAKIIATMKLPMLKRVSSAQDCVVDSVNVIEALNNDVIALNERMRIVELKYDNLYSRLEHHLKTGL